MKVAYIVNQYPAVSHSFIRREILELERQGVRVGRFSIRGWKEHIVDPDDISERERTHFILRERPWKLAYAAIIGACRRPKGFLAGVRASMRLMRQSGKASVRHLAYLVEACAIADHLADEPFDHIHAHFGTNSTDVAMLASLITGIPFSFTVHGPGEFDCPEELGLREKARHATFICAISSFGRGQLYRWIAREDWEKVQIVRCGLDQRFLRPPPEPALARSRFVCIGRLSAQKGQSLLIEAASQLAREGIQFELVLVGDGEMRCELEQLISDRNLSGTVRITGWRSAEEVRSELLSARALVLPSFAEGIPVVIMEAMALRRTVITTFVAGIPELVLDGETGWLVPAGSISDLVRAMRTVLSTADGDLARMGTRARERVLAMHSIDAECDKLVTAMQSRAPAAVSAGGRAAGPSGAVPAAVG